MVCSGVSRVGRMKDGVRHELDKSRVDGGRVEGGVSHGWKWSG